MPSTGSTQRRGAATGWPTRWRRHGSCCSRQSRRSGKLWPPPRPAMIAKGNFHSHGVRLAAYLVKAELGERGELIDMRGFGPVSDLRDGFRVEQIRAQDGTKAEKPFFHVHLRGAHGEGAKLSRENWKEIADRCDKALGPAMADQPRAASLHIDRRTGDMHLHLGYSLVAE